MSDFNNPSAEQYGEVLRHSASCHARPRGQLGNGQRIAPYALEELSAQWITQRLEECIAFDVCLHLSLNSHA